jgi:rubrerythrin
MDAATERMAEGLKKAIEAEIDGYHFYMMAANNTDDEQGREVFQMLASEEVEHANFLKAQYAALTETGKADANLRLKGRNALEGDHPIFSPELKSRTKSPNYEMSALSIGAQLELQAIQFYKGEADAATDVTVASFYEELAAWEKGHYDALTRQLESLRGEHWDVGGFSPF